MMQVVIYRIQIRLFKICIISFPEKVTMLIDEGMNTCIIFFLVFTNTFDKIFQNILVGTREQSGVGEWVHWVLKSWKMVPKMCGVIESTESWKAVTAIICSHLRILRYRFYDIYFMFNISDSDTKLKGWLKC